MRPFFHWQDPHPNLHHASVGFFLAREITETSDLVGFEKDHAFILAVSVL